MPGAGRSARGSGCRRRAPVPLGLLAVALLLTGCPSGAPGPDPAGKRSPVLPGPALSAPVRAAEGGGRNVSGPLLTVDLAGVSEPGELALDVAATHRGDAVVLVGSPAPRASARLLLFSGDGRSTGSVAVPGLVAAWQVHPLPDGTAVVTGHLADVGALGFVVVDLGTGAARTVPSVPLDADTSHAAGNSVISSDGRTVWLYTATLADGRYLHLLTGQDVATGELVAARDLFPELRAIHDPHTELDVVGLVSPPGGGVVMAVNVLPPATSPLWRPVLLVHDVTLEPATVPIALGPREAALAVRSVAMADEGTTFAVLRGSTASWVVSYRRGQQRAEPLLEWAGVRSTDALAVDALGRVVLPGPVGARGIDVTTGETAETDVGCAGAAGVTAFAPSPVAGTWMLGGCFEEGVLRSRLWRVA